MWFRLNPQGRFPFLLQENVSTSPKEKLKVPEYWCSVFFRRQHSPPDKAVPESGRFLFSPLRVCELIYRKAEPCSCLWRDIKSVERVNYWTNCLQLLLFAPLQCMKRPSQSSRNSSECLFQWFLISWGARQRRDLHFYLEIASTFLMTHLSIK